MMTTTLEPAPQMKTKTKNKNKSITQKKILQISKTKKNKSKGRKVEVLKIKESVKKQKIKEPKKPAVVSVPKEENKPVKKEKKPRKPSFEKMYFTKETEDAIVEYNKEENEQKRNEIFNAKIKFAFEKVVENVFNTFKFSYFDVGPIEVQKETLSHLVANIHKYEAGKGKAFSYFSIIAKHYLIFHNNANYKRYNQQVDISEENEENTVRLQSEDTHYKNTENRQFIEMMVRYWDENLTSIFNKRKDLKIAEAVVELFRNSDRIDHFNKKALYLYIREISSCKTQQITKVINKMKEYQNKITRMYLNEGKIDY